MEAAAGKSAHELIQFPLPAIRRRRLEVFEHRELETARTGRTSYFYEEIRHSHEGDERTCGPVVGFDGAHDPVEFAVAGICGARRGQKQGQQSYSHFDSILCM